jgi:hypothetical protein
MTFWLPPFFISGDRSGLSLYALRPASYAFLNSEVQLGQRVALIGITV